MSYTRVLTFLFVLAQAARACTCVESAAAFSIPQPSYILFRGIVTQVERLPVHPKMRGRQRYAVPFWLSSIGKERVRRQSLSMTSILELIVSETAFRMDESIWFLPQRRRPPTANRTLTSFGTDGPMWSLQAH
jgi:hypothetical protein